MLSSRASRYLQTLERRPFIEDLGMVREALQREGIPATDALLDFHQVFAGYVRKGRDEVVYGLLHHQPKWLDPLRVDAFQDDESAGVWYIACADGHPSYDLRIDQSGIYYTTCCVPRASSFFMWTEQVAFVWEFAKERKGRNAPLSLWNDRNEMIEVLLPCLTERLVESLSDKHSRTYATDLMVVSYEVENKEFSAYVAEGAEPPELAGFRFQLDEEPKSLLTLQKDLRSRYQGRRYQAICALRETTEPAAAPLFLSVLDDESRQIRIMAIQGLGRVRSRDVIPSLRRLICEDSDEMIVLNAIMALKEIGGPQVFPALMDATQHSAPFLRRDAARALGQIGDRSVLPALEALLNDNESPQQVTGLCITRDNRRIRDHVEEAIDKIANRSRH